MGWAGKGKIPQRAQPQSTAAVQGSSGAAHLPVSPPVRSPARWGSMAGSPLLHGPRAGGVGLLVLLLLGLLGPPRTLCARPVKEPRSLGAASPPLAEGGRGAGAIILGGRGRGAAEGLLYRVEVRTPRSWDPRYLLGRILTGIADTEAVAAPRRLRRAADQDTGPELPPEGVLGALLRVKRLETPAPQAPARRLLP
nr:PREDICTED: proSAAS [Bos mutus]